MGNRFREDQYELTRYGGFVFTEDYDVMKCMQDDMMIDPERIDRDYGEESIEDELAEDGWVW